MKHDEWSCGHNMLEERSRHCSLAIVDPHTRITKSILVIGGNTSPGSWFGFNGSQLMKSTEIYDIATATWRRGPDLPIEISYSSCVSAPVCSQFACYVVGGCTKLDKYCRSIFALTKDLSNWKLIGHIGVGRNDHITIPLS